jgi:hypothetical protein
MQDFGETASLSDRCLGSSAKDAVSNDHLVAVSSFGCYRAEVRNPVSLDFRAIKGVSDDLDASKEGKSPNVGAWQHM